MIFDVSELDVKEKYHLLNGGVTLRPIAGISTCSSNGVNNLAPYSFFTVTGYNPPVLLYTQVTQKNGIDKDTLQYLIETGECVVNIANFTLLDKVSLITLTLKAVPAITSCLSRLKNHQFVTSAH